MSSVIGLSSVRGVMNMIGSVRDVIIMISE